MVDLEAARERIRQASAGPWAPSPKASDAVIAPNAQRDHWHMSEEDYGGPVVGESIHPLDRDFIVHARTDLPAALDELEVARKFICEADSVRAFLPLEVVRKLDAYDEAIGRINGD